MNRDHPLLASLFTGDTADIVLVDGTGTHTRAQLVREVQARTSDTTRVHGTRVALPGVHTFGDIAQLFALHAQGAIAWLGQNQAPTERFTPNCASPLCYAVATSGSTGAPKWVALSEQNVRVATVAIGARLGFTRQDRVLCPLPLTHTYGLSTLWCSFAAGSTLILPHLPLLGADLVRWAGEASVLALVPSQLRILIAALRATGTKLPRLRMVTLAGQGIPKVDRENAANVLPHVDFVVCYGMTEATTRITMQSPDRFLSRPDCVGTSIYPEGVTEIEGELVTRGAHVSPGYWDDERATNTTFANNSLRTGDFAVFEGGEWRILGRKDGMIKRFGEKVFPEQIEAALLAQPGVGDAWVRQVPSDSGEPLLVATIVATNGFTDAELRRDLRGVLPPYAVPERFERTANIPRTETGKLRRT